MLILLFLAANLSCVGRSVIGERATGQSEPLSCDLVENECSMFEDSPQFPSIDPAIFENRVIYDCDTRFKKTISVTESDSLKEEDLSCTDLEIKLLPDARFVLEKPFVYSTAIRVAGPASATFIIKNALGKYLWIGAEGTPKVRITEKSQLAEVQLDVDPEMMGTMVSVKDASMEALSIRTGPFTEVEVARSQFKHLTAKLGRLLSEDCTFRDSIVDAKQLIIIESSLQSIDLKTASGLIVASEVIESTLHKCDTFLFSFAKLNHSYLARCDVDPLKLRDSMLEEVTIKGGLQAENTFIEKSAIGQDPDADLLMIDSILTDSVLCDMYGLWVKNSQLLCVACDPEPPVSLCSHGKTTINAPQCVGLTEQPCLQSDE